MTFQQEYVPIEINRGMLSHCTPIRNFVYGILVYLLFLLIAPITVQAEYDFSAAAYVVCTSIAFLCGNLLISRSFFADVRTPRIPAAQLRKIVTILFCLSAIGLIAKFVDSFLIREMSASLDAFENREVSEIGSANPVAIIAAFLMYAPYLLLLISILFEKNFNLFEKISIWFLFLCQILYPLIMGSRSGVLFPFLFLTLSLFYAGKIKFRVSVRLLGLATIVFLLGCAFAGKVLKERIQIMYTTNYHVANVCIGEGAAATVPATEATYSRIVDAEDDSFLQYFLLGYVNICQYYLHGVFEFPGQKNYVDNFLQGEHTNGTYMFAIYMKFIHKIFQTDAVDTRNAFFRPGIFNSVWGSIYTDFGWWGIAAMFFWGLVQKIIWGKTFATGNLILLPWVFLGGMVIFLFPLLNLFVGTFCYAFSFVVVMYFLCPINVSPLPNIGEITSAETPLTRLSKKSGY